MGASANGNSTLAILLFGIVVGGVIGFSPEATGEPPNLPNTIAAQVVLVGEAAKGVPEYKVMEFHISPGFPLDDGSPYCEIQDRVVWDFCKSTGQGIRIPGRLQEFDNSPTTKVDEAISRDLACSVHMLSETLVHFWIERTSVSRLSPGDPESSVRYKEEHDMVLDLAERHDPSDLLFYGRYDMFPVVSYTGRIQLRGGLDTEIARDLEPLFAENPGDITVRIPLSCPYLDFPAVQSR